MRLCLPLVDFLQLGLLLLGQLPISCWSIDAQKQCSENRQHKSTEAGHALDPVEGGLHASRKAGAVKIRERFDVGLL